MKTVVAKRAFYIECPECSDEHTYVDITSIPAVIDCVCGEELEIVVPGGDEDEDEYEYADSSLYDTDDSDDDVW